MMTHGEKESLVSSLAVCLRLVNLNLSYAFYVFFWANRTSNAPFGLNYRIQGHLFTFH